MKKSEKRNQFRAMVFAGLILLQLAMAAGIFLYYYRDRPGFHFGQEELLLARNGAETVPSGYVDNSFEGSGRRLETPAVRLDRGIYRVHLTFQTGNSLGSGVTGVETYAAASGDYPWIRSARARMLDFQDSVSYRIYVDKNGAEAKVIGALDDGWDSWLMIRDVDIVYLPARTAARGVASAFFVFLAADLLIVLAYRRKKGRSTAGSRKLPLFVSTAAALVSSAPVLAGYLPIGCLPEGMDLHFHLTRIVSLAAGLEAGYFPVRIYPGMLNGYGYANGLFYGDLFLYIPAVLYLIGFSVFTAYRVLVIGMNLLTALLSTYSFGRLSGDRTIGALTGAAYTLSLYRLTQIYSYSSVGQWTAMAFLPLVVLGFYRLYENAGTADSTGEKDTGRWLTLSAGMTLILLTHILTFLLTVLFLTAAALLMGRKTFRREVIVPVLKAAGASILFSSSFLVPFLDGYLRHTLNQVTSHGAIYLHTVFVPQMFSNVFSAAGDSIPYGTFSSMQGEAPSSLGMVSALILLTSLYIALAKPAFAKEHRLYKWLILTAAALWLCTDLFPYAALMDLVPGIAGVFRLLQFASRFLTICTILVSVLHLINIRYLAACYGRPAAVQAAAVILLVTAVLNGGYLMQYCHEASESPNEYDIDRTDMLNVGAGEYLPDGYGGLYDSSIRTGGQGVEAEILRRRGLDIESRVTNPSGEAETADYPLLSYKVYRAVSDAGTMEVTESEDKHVRVVIPPGFDGRITVEYREPVLWRAAELVSLGSLAALACYRIRKYRNRKPAET